MGTPTLECIGVAPGAGEVAMVVTHAGEPSTLTESALATDEYRISADLPALEPGAVLALKAEHAAARARWFELVDHTHLSDDNSFGGD